MAAKRIFISFAIEDERYRDLLKGQSLNTNSPFTYVDMSAKEAWDSKWRTNCRIRIKGSDGVIALISKHSRNADGAKWEMQCANEEGIPMIGINIHKDDKATNVILNVNTALLKLAAIIRTIKKNSMEKH